MSGTAKKKAEGWCREGCRSSSVKWAFSGVSPAFPTRLCAFVKCGACDIIYTRISKTCKPDTTQVCYFNHFCALIFFSLLCASDAASCSCEICHWMAHKYLCWTHKNALLSLKLVTYTCVPNVPCNCKVMRRSPLHFGLIRERHEKPTAYK